MIVTSPTEFLAALGRLPPQAEAPAVPRGVFMVAPERFRVATESARDNPYMDTVTPVDAERALRQAKALVGLLRGCGVPTEVFPGRGDTPDAVFPNNVFATTPGALIVGRMLHPGRQREARRRDIRAWFAERGYRCVDLSGLDCVAELTGPLVIDRARGIGLCGMSTRVDEAGLEAMHEAFGLRLTFRFDLVPTEYHANVVLSVLASRACVLHPGAFVNPEVPDAIAAAFPGRTLFLDEREKNAFAGNCIALTDRDLFMSRGAVDALRAESRAALESWGFRLHATELDEIEKAGGSLRCMVAEIY